MDEIIVTTQNEIDDYLRFSMHILKTQKKFNVSLNIILVSAAVILMLGLVFMDITFIVIGTVFLVIRFLFKPLVKLMVKSNLKKLSNEIKEEELKFTETELSIKNELSHSVIPWHKFTKIEEDEVLLYLFLTQGQAVIVKKDRLSQEQYEQILIWLSPYKEKLSIQK